MEKRRKKRRKIEGTKKLVLILDGLLVIALIAAAVVLINRLANGTPTPAAVSAEAVQPADADAPQTPVQAVDALETAAPEAANQPEQPAAAASLIPAELTEAVSGDAADALTVDFDKLSGMGIPAVAYLCSADTAISYPVVQNMDNEYYMARDMYGKKDKNGAIYLDSRNTTELLDDQIIIYGNPNADGSMFGSLAGYSEMSYYEQHRSLNLYAKGQAYRIDVFAAHRASPDMANYPILFQTPETRADYIAAARGQSFFQTNVEIADDAKLVCLVTAADFNAGADACFVVYGVLTPV